MTITHTARSGKIYYLHRMIAKTGRPKYFFSSKDDGNLADRIPDGYEIYENVRAQVFLRKKSPPIIRENELQIVQDHLRKDAEEWKYRVEIKKRMIVIHEARGDYSVISEWASKEAIEKLKQSCTDYMPMMRFILIDDDKRTFAPQRYCFRGSVEDWIDIGKSDSMASLARRYMKHLGKDSFYELF